MNAESHMPHSSRERSLRDFAHLFISGIKEEEKKERDKIPLWRGHGALVPFLDGGEAWLKVFTISEMALVFLQWTRGIRIYEEGFLFPTISGQLEKVLGSDEARNKLTVLKLKEFRPDGNGDGVSFIEMPYFLPGKMKSVMQGCRIGVMVVPEDPPSRLRALHATKILLNAFPGMVFGVVVAEEPGSGNGREVFHRFAASNPDYGERLLFLGAIPMEPFIKKVSIPERKPCLVYYPSTLAATGMAAIGANLRRVMEEKKALK